MKDMAVPTLFTDRKQFLARAIEKLGSHPSDFHSVVQEMNEPGRQAPQRRAAGVLVPLLFRTASSAGPLEEGFTVQLIKRSVRVSQPGDLSCPGGMIHPHLDRLLRPLLVLGPLPIFRGRARVLARQRGVNPARVITLFLTTALRESWEEIRLSPSRVRFLGPLPTYALSLFSRTIFPLVGFVEETGPLHPNGEVEKMVEVPLASFYREDLIGCYRLSVPDPQEPQRMHTLSHPCLIHRNPDGGEDILWGATFCILTRFLEIVMDYRLPAWQNGRVVERILNRGYLTGASS